MKAQVQGVSAVWPNIVHGHWQVDWEPEDFQTRYAVKNFAFHNCPLKYQLQNVNTTFLREHLIKWG